MPALAAFRAVIARVPRGKVITYGQVAYAAGYPRGARMTAWALRGGIGLPWHRVVAASGRIALRGPEAMEQRLRLELEGVTFRGGRVQMGIHNWVPNPKSPRSGVAEVMRRTTPDRVLRKRPRFRHTLPAMGPAYESDAAAVERPAPLRGVTPPKSPRRLTSPVGASLATASLSASRPNGPQLTKRRSSAREPERLPDRERLLGRKSGRESHPAAST